MNGGGQWAANPEKKSYISKTGQLSYRCLVFGISIKKYRRYKKISESNGGFCSGSKEKYTDCNTRACSSPILGLLN